MNLKKSTYLFYFVLFSFLVFEAKAKTREQVLRDSTIKYGVPIEPYLKSLNDNKIVAGFNYAPHINKFLKEHKYVKFPPYPLTIGFDDSFPNYKSHILTSSGNRLYFPKGSSLVCPKDMKTNGYMVFIAWNVSDVFIDGINLTGSKVNDGYITSPYGAGIAMYGPSNVLVTNATISKSSGDGITVRVQWKKQSENITINNAKIFHSTRVGMLVNGIVNGTFNNIYIEGTGEKQKDKVQKPQTGLSFEPNDCTSRYVNCKFNNLNTKNNIGPVLATTNFYNLYVKNTCGANKVDVVINKWNDYNDDPECYGASFDVSGGSMEPYDTKDLSGTFKIINPTIVRNTKKDLYDYYFLHGQGEKSKGGVKYTLTNLKLVHRGTVYNLKNKNKSKEISSLINSGNLSNKVLIK